jgi:hypothetical protein
MCARGFSVPNALTPGTFYVGTSPLQTVFKLFFPESSRIVRRSLAEPGNSAATACIVHKWLGICEQCRLAIISNGCFREACYYLAVNAKNIQAGETPDRAKLRAGNRLSGEALPLRGIVLHAKLRPVGLTAKLP